ncbi:glycosyltransferase [bacterium]|nr:glycosyltransferase [bacterium]
MNIACIGNFPPRECGIATFTRHFISSIFSQSDSKEENSAFVVALNDHGSEYDYSDIVKYTIRQDHQRDYFKAAKFINYSDAEICFLQHEFGIFGGDSGVYILPLIHRLKIPLVTILHTVLKHPSYNERMIINELGKKSERLVVMSQKAIRFLTDIYKIPIDKIKYIGHGVPAFDFIPHEYFKKRFKLEDRKSLLTFGLLSRNKGIETVLHALPNVVKKHPEVLYIVLGKTHPNVIKVAGEEYRNYLKRLVKRYQLEKHVYFYNSFVQTEELLSYLAAVDIYITPYRNKAQATSGTLAYAVGAGTAVLSTPYWHAEELLADGRGKLFNFDDSNALAVLINMLLDKPDELFQIREKAYNYGRKITWPIIGSKYYNLAVNILLATPVDLSEPEEIINPSLLPKYSLEHVMRLTDDTGIIQHAKFSVPNYKEGYCLDDNARALLVCLMAYRQKKDPNALKLIPVYLGFMHYMQNDNGTFRNFLSYKKDFLDKVGSEDSFGRAIWALGYLIRYSPSEAYFELGKEMFLKAVPNFEKFKTIRGIANIIVGLSHYLKRFSSDEAIYNILKNLVMKLVRQYEKTKSDDWHWFESTLTYDNGIIPLALLAALEIKDDKRILNVAQEAIDFLVEVNFKEEYAQLIGSNGWYKKGGSPAEYAQQPIDAAALVMLFHKAFKVIGDKKYIKFTVESFMWFLGENHLRIPLYDFETKGCNDGLESYGVNRNQGAESILAYMISHLTLLFAHEAVISDAG